MRSVFAVLSFFFLAPAVGCSGAEPELIQGHHTFFDDSSDTKKVRCPRITDGNFTWLAITERIDDSDRRQSHADRNSARTTKPTYIPWPERKGPAYPGDLMHSLGRDAKEMPATLWNDTKSTVTNRFSLATLMLAGVSGAAIASDDLGDRDERVKDHYRKHGSQLNTFWDSVGDAGGNPGLHFAIAGAAYFTGLASDDTQTYRNAKTMINALSITGVTTLALKGAFRTRSPNGDGYGWPSGHSSSSFCFATVAYHQYGPWVGGPLLAFAGFVAYERVDARNHDFSDVISGSLMGIAIGHAVATNQDAKIFGMTVLPYTDPRRGAVGLALMKSW